MILSVIVSNEKFKAIHKFVNDRANMLDFTGFADEEVQAVRAFVRDNKGFHDTRGTYKNNRCPIMRIVSVEALLDLSGGSSMIKENFQLTIEIAEIFTFTLNHARRHTNRDILVKGKSLVASALRKLSLIITDVAIE